MVECVFFFLNVFILTFQSPFFFFSKLYAQCELSTPKIKSHVFWLSSQASPRVSSLEASSENSGETSSNCQYQEDLCSQAPDLVFTYKHWIPSLNFFSVFPAIKLRTKAWPYFCSFAFPLRLDSFLYFRGILFCVSFLQTTSNQFFGGWLNE